MACTVGRVVDLVHFIAQRLSLGGRQHIGARQRNAARQRRNAAECLLAGSAYNCSLMGMCGWGCDRHLQANALHYVDQ